MSTKKADRMAIAVATSLYGESGAPPVSREAIVADLQVADARRRGRRHPARLRGAAVVQVVAAAPSTPRNACRTGGM